MVVLLQFFRSILCLALFCNAADAGDLPEIKTGGPFDPGEGRITALVAYDSAGYYYLMGDADGEINLPSDRHPVILTFDKGLEFTKKIAIHYTYDEELVGLKPISFLKTDSGFILLCSRYSAVERNLESFLLLIGDDGKVEKMLKPAEINDIPKNDADFPFFGLHTFKPADGISRRYVMTVTTPSFLDVPERINFNVYDEHLAVTGSHLLDYPDDYVEYRIMEIISSQTGFFYIRVEISNPFRDGESVHQLVIYDIQNDNFNTLELSIPGVMVNKSALTRLDSDIIGLSGYFVGGPHENEPEGLFYYLFRASTGALLKQNIHHFSEDEALMINPKNLASKSSYQHLKPAGVYLTSHNHVLVLFEYNWKSMLLIRDQEGMLYHEPFYYANEIFLFRFDAANQPTTSEVFPKKQSSGISSDVLGFEGFVSGQNFYLLYNDHPKNEKKYRADELKTMKRKYVMMLGKYDLSSGEFSKSVLEKNGHAFKTKPSALKPLDESSLLFIDESEKTRLTRIFFD